MALATQEAIRDRIIALVSALTPTSLVSDKFRAYRNEDEADFEEWAEKHIGAAFRRFQVREVGEEDGPLVTHLTQEDVRVRFRIAIAYPQTHRYGPQNALDRDDVINQDWKAIKYAITGTGGTARANFTSATDGQYDCTPLATTTKTREQVGKIDYLVISVDFEYVRATA
jgi:hypothetical protein